MKDFFKMLFASLLALLLVIGGGFMVFLVLVAALSAKPGAKVPSGAVLVFDVTAPISDKPAEKGARDLFADAAFSRGGAATDLRTVTRSIRRAAKDDRIKGILLTGNVMRVGYSSGWGALKEIRDDLVEFRKSGKKIIAYDLGYDDATYYLASAADEVIVNPFGAMELKGFAAQLMFFANAFEKYGIQVQVTRVGKYKSAVEPFLLDHMSEANREQMSKLLGDIWAQYIDEIARARKLAPADLQRVADTKGLLRGDEMMQLKLADRLAYFDDVITELKALTGTPKDERTFAQVKIGDYAEALGDDSGSGGRVAVIYAEGEIVDGDDRVQVGGDYIAKLLRKARLDDDVKAVVLRVNSPGGSASASEVIQREVRLLREKKPIVVSMGTVAASGGYWISAYGDRVFAEPGTITGSIGVFGMLPNVQKLVNNIGVNVDTVKTAQYADLGSVFRPKTEAELKIIQDEVDWVYDSFIAKVSEGRKLPKDKVQEIAQGRVWSGVEAQRLGLVDEMGGLQAAIRDAAKRAKLGDHYSLLFYQVRKTTFQQLAEAFGGNQDDELAKESAVMLQARRIMAELRTLASLNDPHGIYARLPFDLM